MASPRTINLIDKLIWRLIYGGLFVLVFGLILRSGGMGMNWLLVAGGTCLAIAGAVLLYVRSRLREDS
ncbi:MAG: hypothetical protein V4757_16815 [Pseudomonadota bacterium]